MQPAPAASRPSAPPRPQARPVVIHHPAKREPVTVRATAKTVTVTTPHGKTMYSRAPAASEADVGAPIYPGARVQQSVSSTEVTKGTTHTTLLTTPDPLDKVFRFYTEALGPQARSFRTGSGSKEAAVVSLQQGEGVTTVAIHPDTKGTGSRIMVVRSPR